MSIRVNCIVPIRRLFGQDYWRWKKPVLEVSDASKQYGVTCVRLRLKLGASDVNVDVQADELRRAIDNAVRT